MCCALQRKRAEEAEAKKAGFSSNKALEASKAKFKVSGIRVQATLAGCWGCGGEPVRCVACESKRTAWMV